MARPLGSVKWIPLGPCVCGKEIFASNEESGIIAVMHTEPRCRKFDELEPDKFLTYIRRSRGIPDSAL
jgi:hypothetical protein